MRTLSSSLSSSATNHPRRKGFVCSDESGEKRSNASDKERERALFVVVFVLVLNVSLVSFCPPFFRSSLFLNETRTTLSLSLSSLFCQTLREARTRERERGDCDGIPPWCWKSGFEDEDEDEDFVGDETKEGRGDVDDDDVRDAPSFLVFALVFVRSRDSTDG